VKSLIPNRYFVAGLIVGAITLATLAWFFGPKSISHLEDPLTGRRRYETEWLGTTMLVRVQENEVSHWADQHSIKGIYPGQYGWSGVSVQSRSRWFGRTSIGCGGGHGVVQLIFHGYIKLDGSSREETLQRYQTELIENWKQHGSLLPAIKEWSRGTRYKNMVTNPTSPQVN
jgi:hypothetical protein